MGSKFHINMNLGPQKKDKTELLLEIIAKQAGIKLDEPSEEEIKGTLQKPITSNVPQVPQIQSPQITPSNFGLPKSPVAQYSLMEGSKMKQMLGQTPESEQEFKKDLASYNTELDIDKTMRTSRGKEMSEKYGQAGRVVQAMRNLVGIGKAMDEDFPGGGGPAAYLTGGAAGFPLAPKSLQKAGEPVLAYNAQMQEVKLAMVPILSGQARYVVDLAKAVQETIPDSSRISSVRDTLSSQTVRNIMTLTYGIQNGFFGAEKLSKMGIDPNSPVTDMGQAKALLKSVQLTEEQEKSIEEAVDYVTKAGAIRKGKQSKQKSSFKSLWE